MYPFKFWESSFDSETRVFFHMEAEEYGIDEERELEKQVQALLGGLPMSDVSYERTIQFH